MPDIEVWHQDMVGIIILQAFAEISEPPIIRNTPDTALSVWYIADSLHRPPS